MATWEDVRRLALALPETTESNNGWRIREKAFAWVRPLRRKDVADLAALGREAPDGEIMGIRVADDLEKQALVASEPEVFFTIPHFDGWPGLLVRLDAIGLDELEEVLTDAWLARAPKRLAKAFLESRGLA
ncbi:MmcQ/YjbR family DNA-binding protein [Nocardioides sp. SYSU DS0651]|uniref:MmcQ/YjbR family DNA-binding protein n=1 Tax=Nocardioides sp. SYSU DS0651 TaxID=3415955 RepID=UPI003F4C1195